MNALAKLEDVGCVEVEMIYRDDAEWSFGSGSWDEWADGLRDLARTCGVTVKVLRYEPSEEYEGANYVSVVGHPGALAGFLAIQWGPGEWRPRYLEARRESRVQSPREPTNIVHIYTPSDDRDYRGEE